MKRTGDLALLVFLLAALLSLGFGIGCTQQDEEAVKAQFNPGPPIRKAFTVSLQMVAQQIDQRADMGGQVPQGDGVEALNQAGIRGVPGVDPWGNPLRYHGEGGHYTLSSAGPDQQWGTQDDVVFQK
jgi:hypothetical protein